MKQKQCWSLSRIFFNIEKMLIGIITQLLPLCEGNIIQLLPLCEGKMTICSPEVGNIAWGQRPRAILPVEGEQIVMLTSHKDNNCFIMPIDIFFL